MGRFEPRRNRLDALGEIFDACREFTIFGRLAVRMRRAPLPRLRIRQLIGQHQRRQHEEARLADLAEIAGEGLYLRVDIARQLGMRCSSPSLQAMG